MSNNKHKNHTTGSVQKPRRRFPTTVLVGVCLAAALTATVSATATAETSSANASTTRTAAARIVHVDGYSINTNCTGRSKFNRPTILLMAGAEDPLTIFDALQRRLSGLTRVCSYDRPGEGGSSAPTSIQTLAKSASLLHALLPKMGVSTHRGVVLVAHSVGGLIAAKYASKYQVNHQVRAIVLLDATPPAAIKQVMRLVPANATGAAAATRAALAAVYTGDNPERLRFRGSSLPPVGRTPLTVVQHGQPIFDPIPTYGHRFQELWTQGQARWLKLSAHSRMVVAKDSGHYIYLDQPNLTLRLVADTLR